MSRSPRLRALGALIMLAGAWACGDDSSSSDHGGTAGGDAMVASMSGSGGAAGQGGGGSGGASGQGGRGGAGSGGAGDMDASAGVGGASDAAMDAALDARADAGDGDVPAHDSKPYVYVGSGYWGGGEPGRIAVYELGDDGSLSFVDRIDAGGIASFMVADLPRRLLYVADEGGAALQRYGVDPSTGKLTLDDQVDVPGSNPVYVSLDGTGSTLLSASYGEGLVRLFALTADGFVEPASDTKSTGTEAHSIVLSPDDDFAYVANKGSGTISQFAFNSASHTLTPLSTPSVSSPGPRHCAFSANGQILYVVSELQDSVRAYNRAADGTLSLSQEVARLPEGDDGPGAHVLLSPHGHLYVSNRGPSNTLAVYSADAASGDLSLVEHEPTMGETPRNFSLDPAGRFLLVANQDSKNLVVFSVDSVTGALEYLRTVELEGSPFFVGVYVFPTL